MKQIKMLLFSGVEMFTAATVSIGNTSPVVNPIFIADLDGDYIIQLLSDISRCN